MKKILFTYSISGMIEVPDDATDEEIGRLVLSGLSNRYPFNDRHNFCHNCGAKMEQEVR